MWPAASKPAGWHDHRSEPSTTHSRFPHPIRRASPDTPGSSPGGRPSPLRGEGGRATAFVGLRPCAYAVASAPAKNALSRSWSVAGATADSERTPRSPFRRSCCGRRASQGAQSDNNDPTSAFQPLAVIQVSNLRLKDLCRLASYRRRLRCLRTRWTFRERRLCARIPAVPRRRAERPKST